MKYVFLGPPASGKGTQARRLATEKGLAYLSTGGLLRSEMAAGTEAGAVAKRYLDQGQYVPDEFILPLVQSWCEQNATEGWVLDGFPRTLLQAKSMLAIVPVTQAIALEVAYPELECRVASRLECGVCHYAATREIVRSGDPCPQCEGKMQPRADDNLDNFRSRYSQFQELTQPAIKYFEGLGKLTRVDGDASPDRVFLRLQKSLV